MDENIALLLEKMCNFVLYGQVNQHRAASVASLYADERASAHAGNFPAQARAMVHAVFLS